MEICECVGCEQEAEYYDDTDNKICEDHMEESIRDEGFTHEDFEKINPIDLTC